MDGILANDTVDHAKLVASREGIDDLSIVSDRGSIPVRFAVTLLPPSVSEA
jgi:hypothetical protein